MRQYPVRYISSEMFQSVMQVGSSPEKIALFSDMCRYNTLYMIQRAGSGHIGSSFSAMDMVSSIYLSGLELEQDVEVSPCLYFSSKGHDVPGLYSVLIGLGKLPFENLHQLRTKNGLPGHPDVATPYIYANTGSLGMGISKAKGMILARRLKKQSVKVIVMTGDGELQEGQIWESLASAVREHMHELTVLVDYNKLQSDTWVKDTSDLGNLLVKFKAFGWRVDEINGHDIQEILEILPLQKEEHEDRPRIVIAHTNKAQGVDFMQAGNGVDTEYYPYHSGSLNVEDYDRAQAQLLERIHDRCKDIGLPPLKFEQCILDVIEKTPGCSLVKVYGEELARQAGNHEELVVLDADLIKDCGLVQYKKDYPHRHIECGIAEQDMVSQASGLALQGMLPVVNSFACFLSSRPYEQIYNAASEGKKIFYTGTLAGLLPAGPGHSHQGIRDISAFNNIPNLLIYEPFCIEELVQVLPFLLWQVSQSIYLRLCSLPATENSNFAYSPKPGRGVIVKDGQEVCLMSYGVIMIDNLLRAASELEEQYGLSVQVVHMPWLNKIDEVWLRQLLRPMNYLLCFDNHMQTGGLGDLLAAHLAQDSQLRIVFAKFGITKIPECGDNAHCLAAHGLDPHGIVERVINLVEMPEDKIAFN